LTVADALVVIARNRTKPAFGDVWVLAAIKLTQSYVRLQEIEAHFPEIPPEFRSGIGWTDENVAHRLMELADVAAAIEDD
jgi:hypothetical protein